MLKLAESKLASRILWAVVAISAIAFWVFCVYMSMKFWMWMAAGSTVCAL